MWGAILNGISGLFGSAWDKVKGAVLTVVHAAVSVISDLLSAAASAWTWLFRAASAALDAVEVLFSEIAFVLRQVWDVALPAVVYGIKTLAGDITQLAQYVAGLLEKAAQYAYNLVAATVRDLWSVIVKDIWTPLRDSVNNAWNVIQSIWNTVTGWIANPATLVALLFVPALNWIASLADSVIETVVEWALRLFIRSIARVAKIAEDILLALF